MQTEQIAVSSQTSLLRILLVDDDMADVRAIERSVQKSGLAASIEVVSNIVEANEKARTGQYDCILLDYRFPAGIAFELFGELLAMPCSNRPSIVLLTGEDGARIAAECIQRGAQEYLNKTELMPYTMRRVIESACEKAELQRELEHREQELVRMSFYDSLTALPNRQLFFDRLGQAARGASRARTQFAVLMMDLNRFKNVNDTLGHDAGDELLMQVARRLQNAVRESDTVARLGGDEFAAVLSTAESLDGAIVAAEKIYASINEPYVLGAEVVHVGISIGVALFPEHSDDIKTLLRYADGAMYRAKATNSGVTVYNPSGIEDSTKSTLITHELKSALEDVVGDQLFVLYQPQIRLDDGAVTGVEALVRWHHPQLGLLPPGKFIPAAERCDIIEALTLHVLSLTLTQRCRWLDQGLNFTVSVNLSARLLDREGLVEKIASLLDTIHVPPESLCLEVTETGIMRSPEQAEKTLCALSKLGVQISIDDFGTGYSSLKYLRQFPIDEIKIDRLFVAGVDSQHRDSLIVESILALGKAFDVRVVAEGIEDDSTWNHLRMLKCEYGQGYRIAVPLTAEEFEKWHRRWRSIERRLPLVDVKNTVSYG